MTQPETVWNVWSLTISRGDMSLSAAAIVTSCLRGGAQRGEAGGQASWWGGTVRDTVMSAAAVW